MAEGSGSNRNVLTIVLVILVVVVVVSLLLICGCLLCNFGIGGCTMLGPGISDVFSGINSSLMTPVP